MAKFDFFNDTKREISIMPATFIHGTKSTSEEKIKPLEIRTFETPEGTYPWVKIWDYGEKGGLSILVSNKKEEEN